MRVLHVIGQLVPGGSEKMTLQIANELALRGSSHAIVALSEVDRDFVGSVDGEQIPVSCLGFDRAAGPLSSARILNAIARIAKDFEADLVQGHAWRSSVAAGLIGKALRLPAVATLHRIYYPRLEIVADRTLQRLWRTVVVDSHAVRDLLSARVGIRRDRMHVIPNFVAPHLFEMREDDREDRTENGPIRVLMAAHFTPVKGHRFLIDALADLESGAPGRFEVDLVGDGPLLEETRASVNQAGLANAVHFQGSRFDLVEWLKSADIVVLPSLWEGFGLILAEAAACAKPAISFSIGGAKEVIIDGETGLLVPPGDAGALARALARLHGDPALRRRLGDAARRRAAELYAMEPVLDSYEALYTEARSTR